jgi:hypothetical protein
MRKFNYAPIALLFLALLFNSCSRSTEKTASSNYFDLKAYFATEAARLQAANPSIRKTVAIDGSLEKKQLKIEDWTKELSAFTDADINKAAWRGMFSVDKKDGLEQYKAKNDDVPVQLLVIKRKDEKITSIEIKISNKNALYISADELNYYPDSLYTITKMQAIRLKDPKTYEVRGVFINAATQPPVRSSTAPLL